MYNVTLRRGNLEKYPRPARLSILNVLPLTSMIFLIIAAVAGFGVFIAAFGIHQR